MNDCVHHSSSSSTETSSRQWFCSCHEDVREVVVGSLPHDDATSSIDAIPAPTDRHEFDGNFRRMHSHRNNDSNMVRVRKLATALAIIVITAPTTMTAFTVERQQQSTLMRNHARQGGIDRNKISLEIPMNNFDSRRPLSLSSRLRPPLTVAAYANEDEDATELPPPTIDGFDFEEDDVELTTDELRSMTVAQLKQQLRLRGKKVTGNKAELVERLMEKKYVANEMDQVDLQPGYSKYDKPMTTKKTDVSNEGQSSSNESDTKDRNRVAEAKAKGADIVDVTNFIDAEEVGKSFRSSDRERVNGNDSTIDVEAKSSEDDDDSAQDENGETSSSPEVWGEDARIVDDYEGRSVVVDGLSRTLIEFTGSNNTQVQAYVVGSKDSLRNFMRGGDAASAAARLQQQKSDEDSKKSKKAPVVYSSMEEEVYAIQAKRENESKRGLIRPDEVEGTEDSTDPGVVYNTVERDYGDWGVYTPTGAQMSSTEVQGVLLLSDVYGAFSENTRALADKIAFECQPAVVMVPDMFRGTPWTTNATLDEDGVERNEEGKTYEGWRATHPEGRVDIDVRAAAAVLRKRYDVSSIAVWGTCYGGGRALEAAAGWYAGGPESYYEDTLGSGDGNRLAPPHIDPIAAIAWYPTRYDARKLFGVSNEGFRTFASGEDRKVAVMAVFGGKDTLPGSTPEDAALLKECLEEDPRVKDCMVKIFPGQGHAFAHANIGMEGGASVGDDESDRWIGEDYGSQLAEPSIGDSGDAEVACLLSTAWMETYTRVFLPTVGTPVRYDVNDRWATLEMDGEAGKSQKQIRTELDEAIFGHEDVDVNLRRMSQSRSPLSEEVGAGSEAFDEIEDEREGIRRQILEKYDIKEDDDEETFDRKFERARADGALDGLMLEAYMDDSGDAYW